MAPLCAICNTVPAVIFCKNDVAFLCTACEKEAHDNLLARRHERVPVELAEVKEERSAGQLGMMSLENAASIPSLGLLLEMNAAVDTAQLDTSTIHDDLMASLLSFDDLLAPLDFGVDLSLISPSVRGQPVHAFCAEHTVPQPPAQLIAPANSYSSGELIHTTSSRDDAVVPVLPSSLTMAACPQLLPSEPARPLSPSSRVVTTGSHHLRHQPSLPASSSSTGLLPKAAIVQVSSGWLPAIVPVHGASPALATKPEPVTTNAAAAAGVGGGVRGGHRKREGWSFMPGAPRQTAKLARMVSEGAAGLLEAPTMSPSAAECAPSDLYRVVPGATSAAVTTYHSPGSSGHVDNETRADKLARYRAKKARRKWNKVVRYQTRKDYAEVRPRIKGRFVSPEEYAAWKVQQEGGSAGPAEGDAADPHGGLRMVPILNKH